MMRQLSFATAEHLSKKRVTRREKFLGEMDKVVPWPALIETVQPHYFSAKRGRPPIGLERMLRLYFVEDREFKRPFSARGRTGTGT